MEKDPTKDITQDNIRELLESFSKTIYRSRDAEPGSLVRKDSLFSILIFLQL